MIGRIPSIVRFSASGGYVSFLRSGEEFLLDESLSQLEERLGQPVTGFCYPRGLRSRRVEAEVIRHYDWAVVRGGRAVWPATSPYRLERVPIRRDMNGSLLPVVRSRVWLEERLATAVRALVDAPKA